jgi:PKD repeat protein
MRISIYFIWLIGVFCLSCQKVTVPEDVEGTPVFSFSGLLDNTALDIVAGEEGYVMRTSSEADTSGVRGYVGTFEPLSCCSGKLRFIFRDSSSTNPSATQSLVEGDYDYLIPMVPAADTVYEVQFTPSNQTNGAATPESFYWNFGDGDSSTSAQPTHIYEANQDYVVRLSISASDGCTAEMEKTISIDEITDCDVDFNLFAVQQGFGIQAMVEPASPLNPDGLSNWIWNGIDSSISYTIFPAQGELEQICMGGQLANSGCIAEICKGVYITGQQQPPFIFCEANFSYSAQPEITTQAAPDQLGTVIVEYEDEQGKVFTSALGPQDAAQFTVLAIEAYERNENGMPTQKIDLQMSCRLYDAAGVFAFDLSGDAVIAVGTPE